MEKDKAVIAAEKKLKPLIEWAKTKPGTPGQPGAYTLIAEALSKKLGKKIHRQMVAEWLNPDAAKRKHPLFGTGLLLVEIGEELISKDHDNTSAKL